MSEVKFRVYDKNKNKTFQVIELHKSLKGDCKADYCYYLNEKNELKWLPLTDGILMQYTGFKDKKGQEIYEGNIVKAWHEENNGLDYKEYNDVGKVVWGNGCWIIKMTSRDFAMALCDYDTELDIEIMKEV